MFFLKKKKDFIQMLLESETTDVTLTESMDTNYATTRFEKKMIKEVSKLKS